MKTQKSIYQIIKPILFTAAFVQAFALQALSYEADSYSGYDSIVKELTSSTYSNKSINTSTEMIKFHAGLGVLTSRLSMNLPKGLPSLKTLRGFEARFGIDLFSPNWVAETAVRTFNPEEFADAELSMREFDLLLLYTAAIDRPIHFNIGGGMSARYLDISGGTISEQFARKNTTPASVLTTGLHAFLTPGLSIGAQLSYRSPIVRETIDNGSLDGSVRLAGRF
ncbi:MAG: hypothetical protein KDD38_09470 [Bdellovibrionales bacterium]|nr:hypothetical protein [Bdellovibrionales bacterium]